MRASPPTRESSPNLLAQPNTIDSMPRPPPAHPCRHRPAQYPSVLPTPAPWPIPTPSLTTQLCCHYHTQLPMAFLAPSRPGRHHQPHSSHQPHHCHLHPGPRSHAAQQPTALTLACCHYHGPRCPHQKHSPHDHKPPSSAVTLILALLSPLKPAPREWVPLSSEVGSLSSVRTPGHLPRNVLPRVSVRPGPWLVTGLADVG